MRGRGDEAAPMRIEPYLFFPGNCEEALAFYQSVFGGAVTTIMRYGDVPPGAHPTPSEMKDKIMHATLVSGDLTLMASDSMMQKPGTEAERVSLSVGTPEADAGRKIFEALAAGGSVTAPYDKQFWGATFGMVTDRFGIDWMVSGGES
jgi:PhnB protein